MMGKKDEGDPYKKGKAFPLSSEARERFIALAKHSKM